MVFTFSFIGGAPLKIKHAHGKCFALSPLCASIYLLANARTLETKQRNEGSQKTMVTTASIWNTQWAGLEHAELDSNNWVQMAFRWTSDKDGNPIKDYRVFGEIRGEMFSEIFLCEDSKTLAYEEYEDRVLILENECIYCVECGEYARNPEFANAVSQTGGYCLDCAPDPDDEKATRWL